MSTPKNNPLFAVPGRLPGARHYWVAYSGGVDSHVLLHLLAAARDTLPGALGAVHVDHAIQPQSGDWAVHCRSVCEELKIPFQLLHADGKPRRGESPEAAARSARYRVLEQWLDADAVLLSAQHRDDQAETLLLQLLRGAGPKGLAAMPAEAALGRGRLLRPLLGFSRAQILDYARQQQLTWVEDPSNVDTRYDRNLLRQRLLPELQRRWPGVSAVLARAAAHQADQLEIAAALGEIDLAACRIDNRCLSRNAVQALPAARQRNVLRHWIATAQLPAPSQAVLERIRDELIDSRDDATPLVHWPGAELRRYRDGLYLMAPLPPHDSAQRLAWDPRRPLAIDSAGGVLGATPVQGEGLRVSAGGRLEVRFRQGGENLQPAGRAHHHALKKLWQEWQVPEWLRARTPLIYIDDRLAAVAGHCVAQGFLAGEGEAGLLIDWRWR